MPTELITAIIALAGTVIGTFSGILTSARLTNYRLSQLEKKVDLHNRVIDRVYKLEQRDAVVEEELKEARHRLAVLEKKQN